MTIRATGPVSRGRLPSLLRLGALLIVVGALFATRLAPASAEDGTYRVIHLDLTSPTYNFDLTNPAIAYLYTNKGDGTIRIMRGDADAAERGDDSHGHEDDPHKAIAADASYKENGTFLPQPVLDSAAYTVTPEGGHSKHSLVFDVIPSTYKLTYDNPAAAPCSTGKFSYSLVEHGSASGRPDAVANGTFAPKPGSLTIIPGLVVLPCIPTASVDVVITPGSQADHDLGQPND